jgi:hypothetical protein
MRPPYSAKPRRQLNAVPFVATSLSSVDSWRDRASITGRALSNPCRSVLLTSVPVVVAVETMRI